MANRPVKLKLHPRSVMKSKNVTRIVGQVEGTDNIEVTKAGGIFTVDLSDHVSVGGASSDIGDFFIIKADSPVIGPLLQMQYGKTGNIYAPASNANIITGQFLANSGGHIVTGIALETRIQAGTDGTALGANFLGIAELANVQSGALGGATGIITVGKSSVGGDVFGGNTYAWAETTAARQVVGFEADTDNRVNGTSAKKGIQIGDIATSVGTVTAANNIALHILAQVGAYGYDYAFVIGDPASQFPLRAAGALLKTQAGTISSGFDLSALTMSSGRWAITLNNHYVSSLNQAGLSIKNLIGLDTSDRVSIYDGAFLINSSGAITAGTIPVGSVTGLGTSVATALAVNVGTDGAFVVKGGALGSPSSAGTMPAFTLGGTVTSNGQSFSGTIANLGTVTTADINGGTIDGAVIGGSSGAAGTFTTLDWTSGGWTSFTPTITATTGTFTSVAASGKWKQFGKLIMVRYSVTITTIGSAAGRMLVPFPTGSDAGSPNSATVVGQNQTSHKTVSGVVFDSTSSFSVTLYDGTFPGTTGETIVLAGFYELA